MSRLISFAFLLLFSPFFIAGSCNKDEKKKKCDPKVACTMMFASVSITVKTSNGVSAELDEVYTIRKSTSEILKYSQPGNTTGAYIVLDDSYQKELQNKQEEFYFVGKKNGKVMVEEPYVLSADCCHVSKVSGRDALIISSQ
ncbi:MAG TPA: hypothetical protein VL098_03745 [Flavipsychrobacter sp.]|nr:hypothetical protein [Flavipsychrobacter sp.]